MNTWKPNLEETKKHYIDWWNGRGIVLNMWEHFQEGVTPHADVPAPSEPKDLNQKWFDPKWRADYLDWYVAHSSLKADMLPVANTQLGPGSLAAILGGVFEGGPDTIWIHPDPNYTDDLKFDPNHPNFLLHKELLKACKAKANGHYYVGMPDLMEGLDVLAAIKGTDKVLLDTVMQPEVVERQMQQINDIYFRVYDELYDIIREGDEMAFCYFSSWAPGRMSKLQSDISTMISTDDYRRFVQPFIREQCQKIDYTLYHLDGVGATHHLPALLEIEELNAIQWTPGVGEPQGGSPKWYDLYRRILAAGKSIMACWVTVDELRPLLDAIGPNGVHLEMDFHNEDEVEEALKIVEEYRQRETSRPVESDTIRLDGFDADAEVARIIDEIENKPVNQPDMESDIEKAAEERILVLDGGMGTMVQGYHLEENDFRGKEFKKHPVDLKGCNDLLNLTKPEVIKEIHKKFRDAGADIITTNTFNAQRISLADYRLEDKVREINIAGARLAREAAPGAFIAGSMGPTPKTCSMASAASQPGVATFSYDLLLKAYLEQAEALIDGGVDALLVETVFDVENARAALEAIAKALKNKGKQLPVMISFTVANGTGCNMLGQSIEAFLDSVDLSGVVSFGLNCVTDIEAVTPLIAKLGEKYSKKISFYPNAGAPDADGSYKTSPRDLLVAVWPLVEGHALNIVGGCCGTNDKYINLLAQAVQPVEGLYITPHKAGEKTSVQKTYVDAKKPTPVVEECECCKPKATAEPKAEEKPKVEAKPATERIFDAIVGGKTADAASATQEAIDEGVKPQDIINGQMIRAMAEVGQRFQDGIAFVPQLLMAGRAMKGALELLKPLLAGDSSTTVGKVLIGTVKGDLHDIGKNLVASMLEGCGFEVVNIGIDVSAEKFVEEIKKNAPDILCMSALLTTTMTYMKTVIDALEEAGLRDRVKVMVGGAPVSPEFADEIGADGYSDNANSAVALAKRLMNK